MTRERDCENKKCPMNEQSKYDKRARICTASLEIWSRCLRWQPHVLKPKKEEKPSDK
jgi:hypothetical protein